MPARIVRRATPLLVVVGRLEARPRHAVLVTGAGLREVVPVTLAWARRRDAARRRVRLQAARAVRVRRVLLLAHGGRGALATQPPW